MAATVEEAEAAVEALYPTPSNRRARKSSSKSFSKGRRFLSSRCVMAVAMPFASAQDHKRVGEGDKGPNTGGMGAYSPSTIITPELKRIMHEIVMPTLRGMNQRGSPFRGVLFAGLMVTNAGPG